MSVIAITRTALKSQVVREFIGDRVIDVFASITATESESDGGAISQILGVGKRLIGFVSKVIFGVAKWLLRNLWDIILTLSFEIAYFDWNQTDAAIESQIRANNLQIVGQLGELFGVGSVWIASIAIAGFATIKWPVLAGKVFLDLAQEGGEEVRAELRSFLSQARNSLARNVVLSSLLTARRLRIFGLEPIENQREPWRIAGAIEEKIESIDNDYIRTFVENAVEGAVDALIEVGYIVTYSIEDFYRSQKLAQEQYLGPQRGVVLTPDDRLPNANIVLTGTQELAKQNIEQALTLSRGVYDRDIGQVVGMPILDYLRGGVQQRKLTIVWKSVERPPWTPAPGANGVKEVSYTIPEVEVGLTWQEIKTAAKSWVWGRCRCTANLEGGRQMSVYGATEQEAEDKLRELHLLCTKPILTISVSREGDRHLNLKKEAVRMYPAYATLVVRRATNETNGIKDLSGQPYTTETTRIELWTNSEPFDFVPIP